MRGSPIRKSSDQRSVDSSPRLIAASYVLHRLLVPRHPPCALNNLTHHNTPHLPPTRKPMTAGTSAMRPTRCSRPLCSSQRTNDHPPTPTTNTPTPKRHELVWRASRPRTQERKPNPPKRTGPLPQDPTACLRRTTTTTRVPTHTPLKGPTPAKGVSGCTNGRTAPAPRTGQCSTLELHPTHTHNPGSGALSRCGRGSGPPDHVGRPVLLRKEVIQPHLPVRLPCYDFVPIADPAFDGSLHKGWATGFGRYRLS